jgi:hypothetical protein
MFPLHDTTRRQICIAAFLGLCVLPTLAIAGLSISRRLPYHMHSEMERLGQELGLDVSIASMEHTLPGVVRYSGLKLSDPETGRELLSCARMDATWTTMTDKRGQTRPAVSLACEQVDSTSSDWGRLYEVLRRRLECQGGRPEIEIRVTADRWTLHDGPQTQVLEAVSGGVGFSDGIQAQLSFWLPEAHALHPVRVWILRNRQISPPANEFAVDSSACPIPCRLLATCFKEAGALGTDCTFAGNFVANGGPDGWSGELNGQLHGVDLGRLGTNSGLPAMAGAADITLNRAIFQRGRIDTLNGRIAAGRCSMSHDMLTALTMRLQWNWTAQMPAARESVAFDRLALDFWIDSHGVSVAGQCQDARGVNLPGAIAVAGGQVVMTQPAAQPQPVAALIQAIAPANEVPLPATRQAGWLARLLPLPDAAGSR